MTFDFKTALSEREQRLLTKLGVRLHHDWKTDRVSVHQRYWECISADQQEAVAAVIANCRKTEEGTHVG